MPLHELQSNKAKKKKSEATVGGKGLCACPFLINEVVGEVPRKDGKDGE